MPTVGTIYMAVAPADGSSFESFSFRAILFFPTLPLLYIASFSIQVYVAQTWEFSSAGGPSWAVCTPREVLAAPVLDRPKHLYISACAAISFVVYGLTVESTN